MDWERSFPPPERPAKRVTRTHASAVREATEAISGALAGMDAETLCNVIYTILADHPKVPPGELERLGNRLGAAAWEKERLDRFEAGT
jgi:hypothetical protein